MDSIASSAGAPLTAAQSDALKKLHEAATQLEGVFVGMLFKDMHKNAPKTNLFGKINSSDQTWNDVLDEKRSDALAKSGSLGIAKIVEQQLRASVIGVQAGAPPEKTP